MFKILKHSWKVVLPFHLVSCGSDTPSFQERPQALIKVSVNTAEDPENISGESFDIDTLVNESSSGTIGSADATASTFNPSSNAGNVDIPGNRETTSSTGKPGSSGRPQANQTVPVPGGTSDAQPRVTPDAKAVAKACAPSMRNLGKPLTVVSVDESNTQINISPNSVIALKLTGDRVKVVLDLDSSTPLAGVCFFLAGHQPELQFSSAASVQALAIVEVGDQANAQINLNGGSPQTLSVDMRGHDPSLVIQGVDASLCEAAVRKNPNAALSCTP